jgi:hypothetical protein
MRTQVGFGVFRQSVDVGHHAAGGHSDLGLADAQALAVGQQIYGLLHIPVVIEWLSLAL